MFILYLYVFYTLLYSRGTAQVCDLQLADFTLVPVEFSSVHSYDLFFISILYIFRERTNLETNGNVYV